ncbi:DEAD/DEAH box helicase [Emcibacter sp. SYSU 3D8]|uniref:DEAD/DEAH box helicase n=1 Tax=Emcibacter sp. SYSU 3D8 TaxID=3133969 RepID=UPI0031FE517C
MPFPATHPALARALVARAYDEPTSVQRAVLEADADGRDLLVSAQTGSGKTVAFGLALAPTLLGEEEVFGQAGPPLALIIAPTRELALQVHRELSWLYDETGAKIATCVGGMDPRQEARALNFGCHIVVGTPGRLRDHMERGRLDTSALRAVVLDEADEMLDLGFREDLEFLLEATPRARRTLMFSATIAREIAALARSYQRDALRIDTVERNRPHADIEYRAIRVAPNEVELGVVNVLRLFDAAAALVFCSTRDAVRHLHASLVERGFAATALSGELTQNERNNALQSLRDGRTKICVATDVAARGLDLPQLDLVIHAELPNNKDTLLHRSGRTGRAGRKGVCVLLVTYTKGRRAQQLLSLAGVDAVWSGPPTAEEIRKRDNERFLTDPIFNEPGADEDLSLVQPLLENRTAEQLALALARIQRSRLPEPEDLFDNGAAREPRRDERGPREPREPRQFNDRGPAGETVWFRLNVGRAKNADPKWILPLLCRLGHVTKRDIGAIRIFDRDTKFEISKDMADRFKAAVEKSDDKEFTVQAAEAPAPRDREQRDGERAPRPERRERYERPVRAADPVTPSRTEPPAYQSAAPAPVAPEPAAPESVAHEPAAAADVPRQDTPKVEYQREASAPFDPHGGEKPARKKERWDGAKRRDAKVRREYTDRAAPESRVDHAASDRQRPARDDRAGKKPGYAPKPWKQGPRPDRTAAPAADSAQRDPSKPAQRPNRDEAGPERSFRDRTKPAAAGKPYGKPAFGKAKPGAERPKRFNPKRDDTRTTPGDRPLRRKPR